MTARIVVTEANQVLHALLAHKVIGGPGGFL